MCIIKNYPASSRNNSEYVVVKSVSQLPQLSVHNNYLTSSSMAVYMHKYIKNSSNYNVEYRDGIKSEGDKIGMPCTHSTVM